MTLPKKPWQQIAVLKLCPDAVTEKHDNAIFVAAHLSWPEDPFIGSGLTAATAWRSAYNELLDRTAKTIT
jgi:hypothetical protein